MERRPYVEIREINETDKAMIIVELSDQDDLMYMRHVLLINGNGTIWFNHDLIRGPTSVNPSHWRPLPGIDES